MMLQEVIISELQSLQMEINEGLSQLEMLKYGNSNDRDVVM